MIDQLLVRVGEFEIDPTTRRLRRRGGATIRLASQPFQDLLYLIVYEASLTRCLSSVRKAIADRGGA
jgi:hypothetical protein